MGVPFNPSHSHPFIFLTFPALVQKAALPGGRGRVRRLHLLPPPFPVGSLTLGWGGYRACCPQQVSGAVIRSAVLEGPNLTAG
jgi:hypothetical protein